MFPMNFLLPVLVGAALALALTLSLLWWRAPLRSRLARYGLAAVPCFSAAYVLWLGKAYFGWDDATRGWLRLWAVPGLWALWLGLRALFDDGLRWRPIYVVLVLLLLLAAWPAEPTTAWLLRGMVLLLCGHLAWGVLSGRADDLDERRRVWRGVLVALAVVYVSLAVLGRSLAAAWWGAVAVDLWSLVLLLALQLNVLVFLLNYVSTDGVPRTSLPARGADGQREREREREQADALLARIVDERRYAESSLTLPALALQLGMPEYRLRQLINRVLGYRNFNVFLNQLRLDEASRRLADPTQMHLPILTIALDVGFGSIGPFNRAFRERYGLTPSAFRQGSSRPALVHESGY